MYPKSAPGEHKIASMITGILFIVASLTAIVGAMFYAPLLSTTNYLAAGYRNFNNVVIGATAELFTSCANIGTAIMLYPYLRRYDERLGIGYVCFRFLEVVFIVIGVVSILSLLSVSSAFTRGAIGRSEAEAIGAFLRATYSWCVILGPHFMLGINTLLYSYVLYRTRLVPEGIAALGIVSALLVFLVALLRMFRVVAPLSLTHLIMTAPVATYEMVLAAFLIARGYRGAIAESLVAATRQVANAGSM